MTQNDVQHPRCTTRAPRAHETVAPRCNAEPEGSE
jgi:hypothetical protein